MEPKGSRKNPYTLVEYNQIGGNWNGGWIKESPDYIIYRNKNLTDTYTGRCAKGIPVPGDLYNEMTQNHIWLGGWVLFGATLRYLDSNDNEYNSTLGSQSNPCPYSIYNEMLSNGIWEGGWIQDSNGQCHYLQVFNLTMNSSSGCGCGCGSGTGSGSCPACGSGSGSGNSSSEGFPINAGKYLVGEFLDYLIKDDPRIGKLYISWTAGNTQGQNNLSEVTVSTKMTNYRYCVLRKDLDTIWVAPYEVAIHGTIVFQRDSEQLEYSIDGRYTIPMEYYQI